MNEKIKHFKLQLARVFDDDLRTEQWQNYVDYAIMSLIGLSTLGIFLSTYDNIVAKYGLWLDIIDYFTLAVFTVEITLRIWCADLIDDKYKGVWGRVRYCLSFYGLMDVLSTYTFYLALVFPIPYMTFKVLRVARLFRIFRYIKAFNVLARAIRSKKNEMLVSLQFLCIITLMLSFILYFVEHEAQPEVYDNGWTSVIWAFAQYIGDPGGFAETPPITFWGRIIACIIGVLGIAIFAVPAGLIGSAFTEVMEKDEKKEKIETDIQKINEYMLVKSIKRGNLFWPAINLSIGDLKMTFGLSEEETLKAISSSKNLRLKNLAAAINQGPKTDMLVVNQFYVNNAYGCFVDRNSSVTIVNPLGIGDNGLSFFDWHIAQLGGFNYVANENFSRTHSEPNKRCNLYTITDESKSNSYFEQYINDIVKDKTPNDWIVIIAGEQVVKNSPYDFHFELGGERGETSFDFTDAIPNDMVKTKQLFDDFSKSLEERCGLKTDFHQIQPKVATQNIARYLKTRTDANVLLITVSYDLMIFNKKVYEAIIETATVLNRNLETKKEHKLYDEEYKMRPIESEYWCNLYLNNKIKART